MIHKQARTLRKTQNTE